MQVYLLYYITVYLGINHALCAKFDDKKSLQKRAAPASLLYYKDTNSNVRITTPVPSLTEVTFCLWMRSTNTNDGTMVSYAVPGSHNEMVLFDYDNLALFINQEFRTINRVAVNDGVCHHICVTWASATGRWEAFVDGVSVGIGTISKGKPIQGGGVLILGQEQDSVGGGFDPFQAFIGRLTGFNLWDYILTNQEIIDKLDQGNIYAWDFNLLLMQGTEEIRDDDICPNVICYNDTDSNVRITTPVPSLTEVTFCLWMKSTSTNDGTLVSYAVPGTHNEMILYDYGYLRLLINGIYRSTTGVAVNDGVCHYICLTWTSVTGRWQIFVDGVLVGSGKVSEGTPIQGGGVLVLGQDQDTVGGGFDPFQAFVGKMTKFNLWDRVLTYQEIINKLDYGNIYSWDISTLLMQGTEKIRDVDICSGAVTCDPHFTTLDGHHYSHQGVCWYTLVKDSSNSKPDFEITARFEPREDRPNGEIRTRVVALNITVGDDCAEVDRLDVVSKHAKGAASKIHIIQTDKNILLN
uniref:Uncharacterized protein LOC100367357 n=1 Tax=Saccoglossus kowalevskii TaxID=10224 RepID=A0ABM0M523_SACKO|nr:PREDICTED: uncharacterized protein LOC100367357 [Saccoglossus kowalevskii]